MCTACTLARLTGYDNDWKLLNGDPIGHDLPASARFAMSPYNPNTMLTDSLSNSNGLIVASPRLRKLIEAQGIPGVEYLPVEVLNHRGTPVYPHYTIIHLTQPVDCLALEACEPAWRSRGIVESVRRLLLRHHRIPEQRLLFRPRYFPDVILVHRRLAHAIDDAGLGGMQWMEITEFPRRYARLK